MNAATQDSVTGWFSHYVHGMLAKHKDQEFLLRSRLDHSLRVADDSRDIADDLGWSEDDVRAAEVLGLLHDVGRFEQLIAHGTFTDSDSVNHGELGWEIVSEEELLAGCDGDEADWILAGIRNHNRREMPEDLDEDSRHFLRLIRDADKLDILHMIQDTVERKLYEQYPELLLRVDPEGPVSPVLVDEIMAERTCSYANMASLSDVHLMKTTWVYGINYVQTLRRIVDRGLLADVRDAVPDMPETRRILDEAEQFIADKLA